MPKPPIGEANSSSPIAEVPAIGSARQGVAGEARNQPAGINLPKIDARNVAPAW